MSTTATDTTTTNRSGTGATQGDKYTNASAAAGAASNRATEA